MNTIKKEETKKAVIYARFSPGSDQNAYSIKSQVQECAIYAAAKGYTVVKTYADESRTGKNDKRDEFQRMISDSQKGEFDVVLVWKFDRFARSVEVSSKYTNILNKNGVKVISINEDVEDNAMGNLMRNMLASWNEFYSVNLSSNVMRGMNNNIEYGYFNGGVVPFGYKSVCANDQYAKSSRPKKILIVDEDKSCYVVEIFQKYAEGESIKDIYTSLNARGITTSYGRPFAKNNITSILKNKVYIGIYHFNGEERPNAVPSIISEELFERVQKRMEFNKKAPAHCTAGEEYLLTTKLFCGECEKQMTGKNGHSHTKRIYRYYECQGRKKLGCDTKYIRKDELEEFVVSKAKSFLSDESIEAISKEVIALCNKERKSPKYLKSVKLLNENKTKQDNIMGHLAIAPADSYSSKRLFDELERLAKEESSMKEAIKKEEKRMIDITADEIEFFLWKLRTSKKDGLDYKKHIIDNFIDKVYIFKDKIAIQFYSQERRLVVPVEDFERVLLYIVSGSMSEVPSAPNKTDTLMGVCFIFYVIKGTLIRKS